MIKNIFKGIKKNVAVLGIVSFFTDVSSEMIFPLLPVFLTTVLGAGSLSLGLIEGVSDSFSREDLKMSRCSLERSTYFLARALVSRIPSCLWMISTTCFSRPVSGSIRATFSFRAWASNSSRSKAKGSPVFSSVRGHGGVENAADAVLGAEERGEPDVRG